MQIHLHSVTSILVPIWVSGGIESRQISLIVRHAADLNIMPSRFFFFISWNVPFTQVLHTTHALLKPSRIPLRLFRTYNATWNSAQLPHSREFFPFTIQIIEGSGFWSSGMRKRIYIVFQLDWPHSISYTSFSATISAYWPRSAWPVASGSPIEFLL